MPARDRSPTAGEVLFDEHTGYQRMLIGRTAQGVSLFCDDERQSTEESQLVYHEALMVPAMLLADRVRRVLIIGSSEGVASQLAVAFGATEVDHVDIDRVAVRTCAELLPYGYTPEELSAAEAGAVAAGLQAVRGPSVATIELLDPVQQPDRAPA